MKRQVLFAALVLAAGMAHAQAPDLKPSAEIEKLSWMLGKWSGNVHWTMEGMEMDAVMSFENVIDGQFIRSTSVMEMMGMKMTETGFTGWDDKAKAYKSWTFTNFAPGPRTETGRLDGPTVVFVSDPWATSMSPEATVSRTNMKKISDKEISFVLEFKKGDAFEKVGEGKFTKS